MEVKNYHYFDETVMPHKKKAKKATPPKSKHQHKFVPCVFEYNTSEFTKEHGLTKSKQTARIGCYCPICGKIGNELKNEGHRWYEDGVLLYGLSTKPTEECKKELDPATRTLVTFWLEDNFRQKYVDLSHPRKRSNANAQ